MRLRKYQVQSLKIRVGNLGLIMLQIDLSQSLKFL